MTTSVLDCWFVLENKDQDQKYHTLEVHVRVFNVCADICHEPGHRLTPFSRYLSLVRSTNDFTSICFISFNRAVFKNAIHTIISWASPVCITTLKNIFSERLSNQVIGGIVAGCIVFILLVIIVLQNIYS